MISFPHVHFPSQIQIYHIENNSSPANLAQPLHNQIHTYKHTYFKPHIKIFFTLSHLITVNNVESMMLSDRSRRDSKLVVKNDLDVFSNLVRKIVSREEKGN